jgi:hypothetical protein
MDILEKVLVFLALTFVIVGHILYIYQKAKSQEFYDKLCDGLRRDKELRSAKNPDTRALIRNTREVNKLLKEFYGQG